MIERLLGFDRAKPAAVSADPGVRSIENPNIPLGDPTLWNEVFGTSFSTDSSVKVNQRTALMYSPVWQAVSLISGDVSGIPIKVYRSRGAGQRDEVSTHPAARLTAGKANPEQSAFDFWRVMMVDALIWNNAFAFIDRTQSGVPMGLYPLLPDRTSSRRLPDGRLFYESAIDGQSEPFAPRDILHIRSIRVDGMDGLPLITQARNSFGLGLATEKFGSKFFANGAKAGGILEVPAAMSKTARDRVEQDFTRHYTGQDAWFKTVVLRENAKFHSVSIAPNEGQFLETRQEQVREVARWFNLPAHKLGDNSRTGYNTTAEENRAYLQGTLSHWLNTIRWECWDKLLTETEQRDHVIEHDTMDLLRMDTKSRFEAYAVAINNRIMNPNEARGRENLPPYEGGDEFLVPMNMGQGGVHNVPDEPVRARNRVLERVMREATRKGADRFLRWCDEKLADECRIDYYAVHDSPESCERLIEDLRTKLSGLLEKCGRDDLAASVVALCRQLKETDYGSRNGSA